MKLKRTDFPWSAEQVALRDGKVLQALSLHGVGVAGKNGDKLRVRMSVAGRLLNVATFTFYQRAEAARVADMATLFFWDYRTKPAVLGDHLFNFSVASAQSDLASLHPALVGVRERFCALLTLHKLEKGVSAAKVKRDDLGKRIVDLEAQVSDLARERTGMNHQLTTLREGVEALIRTIGIPSRIDALERNVSDHDKTIGSIGANSLHANQADHDSKIAALEEYNQSLQVFLDGLKPAVEQLDERVTRIESQTNIQQ